MEAYLSNKHILCINVLSRKVGKHLYSSILVADPSWSPWNNSNRLTALGSAPLSGFLILLPLTAASENLTSQHQMERKNSSDLKLNQDPQPWVYQFQDLPYVYKGFLTPEIFSLLIYFIKV